MLDFVHKAGALPVTFVLEFLDQNRLPIPASEGPSTARAFRLETLSGDASRLWFFPLTHPCPPPPPPASGCPFRSIQRLGPFKKFSGQRAISGSPGRNRPVQIRLRLPRSSLRHSLGRFPRRDSLVESWPRFELLFLKYTPFKARFYVSPVWAISSQSFSYRPEHPQHFTDSFRIFREGFIHRPCSNSFPETGESTRDPSMMSHDRCLFRPALNMFIENSVTFSAVAGSSLKWSFPRRDVPRRLDSYFPHRAVS